MSIYDEFTIDGLEEQRNVRVVAQMKPRYVIEGMDIDELDATSQVLEPADISDTTIKMTLFCVILFLSLVCMAIYTVEMTTIRVNDTDGLPPKDMDQTHQGSAKNSPPQNYYQWISQKQPEQPSNEDGAQSLLPKNWTWTWIGAALLCLSVLLMTTAKAVLMLTSKCQKRATKKPTNIEISISAEVKHKKKKAHHHHPHKSSILLASLTMAMVGSYLIFFDHIVLADASD